MTPPRNPLPSLGELQKRLDAARPEKPGATPDAPDANSMGYAMRFGVELLAGIMVGAGLGYGLDRWLGTAPWLMILCFFLGFAGGFRNMIRAARRPEGTLDNDDDSSTTPAA